MIFPHGVERLPHKAYPGERPSVLQVVFVRIVFERLDFKRVVPVGDIMTLSVRSSQQVKEGVKEPVKHKKHFYLLPEVNLFVSDKLTLVVRLSRDPNENEERQAGVVIKYLFPGIDLIRQHTG